MGKLERLVVALVPAFVSVLVSALPQDGRDPMDEARAALGFAQESLGRGEQAAAADAARSGIEMLSGDELVDARGVAWGSLVIDLAIAVQAAGDDQAALVAHEMVLDWGREALDRSDSFLNRVRGNTARLYRTSGRVAEAAAIEEDLLRTFEETLPPEHANHVFVRSNLAESYLALGQRDRAGEMVNEAIELADTTVSLSPPLDESIRTNLAAVALELGHSVSAESLLRRVVASREERLDDRSPDMLRAWGNLATVLSDRGKLAESRRLTERAVHGYEKAYPPDHPEVLWIRGRLGNTLMRSGDLRAARSLREELVERTAERFGPASTEALRARTDLAMTLQALGESIEARRLLEGSVEALSDRPSTDGERIRASGELARAMQASGDPVGGVNLALENLETARASQNHDAMISARVTAARCLRRLGDIGEARALFVEVLRELEAKLPASNPDVLALRAEMADCLLAELHFEEAVAEYTVLLAECEAALPPGSSTLLAVRANLANALAELDPEQGIERLRESVATYRARRPLGDWSRVAATYELMGQLARSGRVDEAREHVPALGDEILASLAATRFAAPREASSAVARHENQTSLALSLLPATDPLGFRLVETARAAATFMHNRSDGSERDAGELADERRALRDELTRVREALSDVIGLGEPSADDASRVARLARERDRLERALRATLGRIQPVEVTAAGVGARLGPDEAVAAYLFHDAQHLDETGEWIVERRLLAHVVTANDEAPLRLDLGSAEEIVAEVRSWRESIGAPSAGRGLGLSPAESATTPPAELGRALHERLVAPVLAAAPDAERWFVSSHGELDLVPLAALSGQPLDADLVLVDSLRALPGTREGTDERSLLVVGAVDFGDTSATRESPSFQPLPETAAEVDAVAERFAGAGDGRTTRLVGEAVTKSAVRDAASNARFLHVATHGWFDQLDAFTRDAETTEARWVAPLSLCGLALSGANAGRDDLGRFPGILTAEELVSIDLTGCELAVLSACDTSAGFRGFGLVSSSLRTALHGAGVHSALTSLWKVDDAWTRRLMERFYEGLWTKELDPAAALREAQRQLIDQDAPFREWSGWTLSQNGI